LPPIQRHKRIIKAGRNGVKPVRIAEALPTPSFFPMLEAGQKFGRWFVVGILGDELAGEGVGQQGLIEPTLFYRRCC
jgi:hypothetical protein